MHSSPLTQQARPDIFEPKVAWYRILGGEKVQVKIHPLLQQLRRTSRMDAHDDEIPAGFWAELFLLRPDLPRLRDVLEHTDPGLLLQLQHQSHQLLIQSIAALKLGQAPADEHALDTLTVFFAIVLAKRYSNPSSDIIEVVAGLNNVDAIFSELVASLDNVIRKDDRDVALRLKAVRTAISVVSGGYQTALVSYFVNRDFFPAIMRLVQQLEDPLQASDPLLLAGLLANHGKFEAHNPYRVRFADFVNDEVMGKVAESMGQTCSLLRARYIAIQDDTPVGWSVSGTLSYVGLGALAGAKPTQPVLTEEQQRELFAEQPGSEAATMITVYDFALANKLFCRRFVAQEAVDNEQETPFSTFISFTSYLYQHAYRSGRASSYAHLTLLILLILVEDPAIAKLLCDTIAPVRRCRQRPPFLPLPKVDRSYAAAIIDLLADGINHNLRKRLDTAFYAQTLTVLSRLITYLSRSRTKLQYHWSELWRSLLSFVRFLNQYAEDMRSLPGTTPLVHSLVDLLALSLTGSEALLPDASAYDDLFYKLVESGDALVKLRETYQLSTPDDKQAGINTLIGVSRHYQELIEGHRAKKEHLSPREVQKIIRLGYDTLNVETREGEQGAARGFREADFKGEVKRIVRVVVADVVVVVSSSRGS
ncbi:hypothetical protein B0A55_01252 [Friedmanniomyces simplex]|uniref:Armadillo-like helical domain-containing protein n=1 Tax=Friedmanniomyces simplex TaxID=329884 RepID=A0A4U0Y3J4_9PEZI|nr:hypothetical protein B0A55_01252 [Friedmanniomyces simplex]